MQTTKSPQADIIQIGETSFSATNKRPVPVYRAYGHEGKWSGNLIPPVKGSRVKINFNELGEGEVLSYFTESEWLGMRVRLDKRPDWLVKQDKDAGRDPDRPSMVFGSEITHI